MEEEKQPTIINTPNVPPHYVCLGADVETAFGRLFGGPDWERFAVTADEFFEKHRGEHHAHTKFFERFTPYWQALLQSGQLSAAEGVWNSALELTWAWEARNKSRVHKGTPLFFWGGTALLAGKTERGFLLIHQALGEDRDWDGLGGGNPTTLPAWYFVTLRDEEVNNCWRPMVRDLAAFLEQRLADYRRRCDGTLVLNDFKDRFLYDAQYQEATFFFVYALYSAKQLMETAGHLMKNDFATLLELDVALDLYVVVEQVLKTYYPGVRTLHNLVIEFSKKHGLGVHECPSGEARTRIDGLQKSFVSDPNATMTATFAYNVPGCSALQTTLAVAPPLRNAGAHGTESYQALLGRLPSVLELPYNALFAAIEHGP